VTLAPSHPIWSYAVLLIAAVCAAAGQVFFKLGAANRTSLLTFLNPQIASGGILYFLGAVLWIWALSKVPLTVAYPFTILTFVLVYLASVLILGERPTPAALAGVGLVLAGLTVILWSR
jgi:small multidrug resistance pump